MFQDKKILLSSVLATAVAASIGASCIYNWHQEIFGFKKWPVFNLNRAGASSDDYQPYHRPNVNPFHMMLSLVGRNSLRRDNSECQQEMNTFNRTVQSLKSNKTVKISDNSLDNNLKQKIPYSVDEADLKKLVTGLPASSNNTYYWVDIEKNNDEGTITLNAYGRVACFNSYTYDTVTNTQLIESHKITGFQKMAQTKIISERLVKVYMHTNDWIQDGRERTLENYKDGVSKSWGKVNFHRSGTGFVLDKEEGESTYYIATNKHVVDSVQYEEYRTGSRGWTAAKKLHHNLNQIGISNPENQNVYATQIDSLMNENPDDQPLPNLKGLITFGQDEANNKVNTPGALEDVFEFRDKTKDAIKSIQLIADFSSPYYEFQNVREHMGYKVTLNQNHSELKDVVVNDKGDNDASNDVKEKIALDLVIFKVSFQDEDSDPFKSWWSERPTKTRLMQEEDLFTDFETVTRTSVLGQRTTEYARSSTNENMSHLNLEKGEGMSNNKFITGGFPAFNRYTEQNYGVNPNKGAKMVQGTMFSSPYWFQQPSNNRYGTNSYMGQLTYHSIMGQQLGGASGSPIFDKNLNMVGILWGGTAPWSGREREYERGDHFLNWFHWFGQSFDSQKFLNGIQLPQNLKKYNRQNLPSYDLINGDNEFSLKTQKAKINSQK